MRILSISGSLRAASSCSAILGAAALLAPSGVVVSPYVALGELPHFNPDLDTDTPPGIIRALREAVGQSDGLLISAPEYAHGIPGSLKNLLDWLVGSLEFPGKPTALINTSRRSIHAPAQLREVLTTMAARLVDEACITVPLSGLALDAAGIAANPPLADALGDALQRFTHEIRRRR